MCVIIISLGGIYIKTVILLLSLFISKLSYNDIINFNYVDKEIMIFKEIEIKKEEKVIEKTEPVIASYYGPITGYGPDCTGCIGITASGYNVRNNIYYNDKDYGKVRIVAADKSLPFGTIVRIKNLDLYKDDIIAIVLDRGSAIGFKRKVYFDLLYKSEKDTLIFGKRYATFEILRRGY